MTDRTAVRFWQPRRVRVALVASVLINLFFAARFALFEPNLRVQPLCWTNHDGLVVLEGEQTRRYKDAFRGVISGFDVRLDSEGYYHVSLINYWKSRDDYWNITMKIVNELYWRYRDQMTLPPHKIEGPDKVKVTCELTRAIAIEPPAGE